MTINRRISLSFRDFALSDIFQTILSFSRILVDKFVAEFSSAGLRLDMTIDSLQVCFETYQKCLTFDFIAVLMNETLDEPQQTTLPSEWKVFVEDAKTINNLFESAHLILEKIPYASLNNQQKLINIVFTIFKCIQDFANINTFIFESK